MNTSEYDTLTNTKAFDNYIKIFLLWIYLFICSGLFIIISNLLFSINHGMITISSNDTNYMIRQNIREQQQYFLFQFQNIIFFFGAFLVLLTFLTKNLLEEKEGTNISTNSFYRLIILIIFWFGLTNFMKAIFLTAEPTMIVNIFIGIVIMSDILKETNMDVLKKFQDIKLTLYVYSVILLVIYFFGMYFLSLINSSSLFPIIIGIIYIILGIVLKFKLNLHWNSTTTITKKQLKVQ